jgi:hypothetical protein
MFLYNISVITLITVIRGHPLPVAPLKPIRPRADRKGYRPCAAGAALFRISDRNGGYFVCRRLKKVG